MEKCRKQCKLVEDKEFYERLESRTEDESTQTEGSNSRYINTVSKNRLRFIFIVSDVK